MAINMNAPGPWNNFNPVASTPVVTKPTTPYSSGYGNVDLSTAAGQQAYGQAYANQIKLGGLTSRQNLGVSNAEWQAAQPQPTNTGGGISFSFGGGGGGGGGASVPSNVLTPRQFPPYESTYTPPAAVTPDPYNWATRDPYIYGEGLSNAGAAYDIWGSAPGTNPYLMTVPSSYTPGLLGMPPVQLPSNVPSTNVSANLNFGSKQEEKKQEERINLGIADRVTDVNYTGHGVSRARKPGGGNPYPVGHPLNQGSAGAAAAKLAAQAKMKAYENVTMGSRIDALAKPVTSFEAKKEKARVSVAAYNKTPTGKKFSIDMSPKAGTYGGRPRL